LQQLIADVEEKKFDIIIAKELSRLSRNVESFYQLKRLAEKKLNTYLKSLEKQIEKQLLLKRNSLQKFVLEEISK